jgi:hypothetical protein
MPVSRPDTNRWNTYAFEDSGLWLISRCMQAREFSESVTRAESGTPNTGTVMVVLKQGQMSDRNRRHRRTQPEISSDRTSNTSPVPLRRNKLSLKKYQEVIHRGLATTKSKNQDNRELRDTKTNHVTMGSPNPDIKGKQSSQQTAMVSLDMSSRSCHMFYIMFNRGRGHRLRVPPAVRLLVFFGGANGGGAIISTSSSSPPSAPSTAPAPMNTGTPPPPPCARKPLRPRPLAEPTAVYTSGSISKASRSSSVTPSELRSS